MIEVVTPFVVERPAQRYAGRRTFVDGSSLPEAISEGWLLVFEHLYRREIAVAGDPFVRYYSMRPSGLEIELGVPIGAPFDTGTSVGTDVLPAGEYLVARHNGRYSELRSAHERLQEWAGANNVPLARSTMAGGEEWAVFVERYLGSEQDTGCVEIAYLLTSA